MRERLSMRQHQKQEDHMLIIFIIALLDYLPMYCLIDEFVILHRVQESSERKII